MVCLYNGMLLESRKEIKYWYVLQHGLQTLC